MKRLLTIACIAFAIVATGQNTLRKSLRADKRNAAPTAEAASPAYDTVATVDKKLIDIKGYDKPLRSRRETFFATNEGDRNVARIAFTITYLDSKSRQLHKASHNVAADIPPGETRQVSVRSWDSQQAFYYSRSEIPVRASQATPFDISITVDSIFYNR